MEINAANINTNTVSKTNASMEGAVGDEQSQDFSSILSSELPTASKGLSQSANDEKSVDDSDDLQDDALSSDVANTMPTHQTELQPAAVSYTLQSLASEFASENGIQEETDPMLGVSLDVASTKSQATSQLASMIGTEKTNEMTTIATVQLKLDESDLAALDKSKIVDTDIEQDPEFENAILLKDNKPEIKIEPTLVTLDKKADFDLSQLETNLSLQESSMPVIGPISNQPQFTVNELSTSNVKIDGQVGDAGWREAFSEKVLWLSNQNIKSASVQLNPEELGPIDINIKVTQQQASIMINAQHGTTREAIMEAMPTLRTMLADNGIHLQDVTVNDGSSQNGQQRGAFQMRDDDPGFTRTVPESATENKNTVVKQTRLNAIDYYA